MNDAPKGSLSIRTSLTRSGVGGDKREWMVLRKGASPFVYRYPEAGRCPGLPPSRPGFRGVRMPSCARTVHSCSSRWMALLWQRPS
eukprot:352158-Chlamydomonas_euryale.AAC.5